MTIIELIERKRDGGRLTANEIRWLIAGFTDGTVTDYQMAAMTMAVFINGLTHEELGNPRAGHGPGPEAQTHRQRREDSRLHQELPHDTPSARPDGCPHVGCRLLVNGLALTGG